MEKTCGTCSYQLLSCPVCNCEESKCYGWGRADTAPACKEHIERTNTLEQRYQQLEQVAKGMWHELKEVGCPGFRLGMLRGRLLQLGVFVDE